MKTISMCIAIALLSLVSASAFAQSQGAIKVECWGRCDLVNLGQVCDSYVVSSTPVAVACDDTAVGSGFDSTCGSATCRPYGTLVRGDLLSAYCHDDGGYDAVVTCRAPSSYVQSSREKEDDGEGATP
jgi:hypothetical protein